jgi:hypothetical protein
VTAQSTLRPSEERNDRWAVVTGRPVGGWGDLLRLHQMGEVFPKLDPSCLEAACQDIGVAVTEPEVLGIVR